MKAVFVLTPAESKRLIAKAIAQMDEVREALENAYVVIPGGTTNAYVAQELTGLDIDPQRYTMGTSSCGVLCVTHANDRYDQIPLILYKGKQVETTINDVFQDFHLETVIIKGANAVDPEGNVGVITAGFDGGTMGATLGTITSTGMKYVFPVGLDKLVPSVPEAVRWTGSKTFDYAMCAEFGMFCVSTGLVVTEIEALKIISGVEAKLIAAGGIGGSEGAVVIAAKGEEEEVKKAVEIVRSVKGEPAVQPLKGYCDDCPYKRCEFNGMSEEELPAWLKTG